MVIQDSKVKSKGKLMILMEIEGKNKVNDKYINIIYAFFDLSSPSAIKVKAFVYLRVYPTETRHDIITQEALKWT